MRGTWIGRLRAGTKSLISDRRGNAFMLTAAAIIPVIGFVGSAVDIGRAYMTQLRLQQACDAGVLAGRRAMAGASYDDAAEAEADKMFNFNFPEAKYGASGILFSSEAVNAADVAGQASAVLPTALMFMFGKDEFRLSVDCTAKLEISNVDVMMVLDVTGSMRNKADSGDADTKIVALRAAAKDFYATLASADIGDGRLRFGVVPYSSSVNVGGILIAKDPSWISDSATLPSRRGEGWQNVQVCNRWGCWWESRYFYRYEDRTFDVSGMKTGGELNTDTGDEGATISTSWDGCIIERKTTAFAANETAPADAFDMDIDMEPTGSDDTKWKLFLPAITYSRSSTASYSSSTDSTNFVEKGGDYAACPVAAMKLTKVPKTGESGEGFLTTADFDNYIDDLQPRGFTYHDAGMAWGARLLSPTGLFSDENATADNDRPISRHVVFMTDGAMKTPPSNLSHQGQESAMNRIGATSESEAIERHNNRFVQLCRSARQRGMTIWVVSFGLASNASLNSCASSGAAFEADNAAELNQQFQAIARQISKLRLSQ
jgi:Flp pilus assembly protein TadG